MGKTTIPWTDETWNPVTGCSIVSPGCENCYAAAIALRFKRTPFPWTGNHAADNVRLHGERLEEPLHWQTPRRVFVNSMSDLFHELVPDDFLDRVFTIMALTPHLTYQILTKRPERMLAYMTERSAQQMNDAIDAASLWLKWGSSLRLTTTWPLPNVWLGTSVEDQRRADERIPLLLLTPAAVRFLSVEPMLDAVDIGMSSAVCSCCPRWPSRWVRLSRSVRADPYLMMIDRPRATATAGIYRAKSNWHGALSVPANDGKHLGLKPAEFEALPRLDWVICGGESGPHARPMDIDWARSVRDQCAAAGVPFFYKQLGGRYPDRDRLLDGRMWEEMPVWQPAAVAP